MPVTVWGDRRRRQVAAGAGDLVWARIDLSNSRRRSVRRVWWKGDWSRGEERVGVFGLGVVRGLMRVVELK